MNTAFTDRLCDWEEAFDLCPETEKLFIEAMMENYSFQLEKQPYIGYLAQREGFDIAGIKTIEDIYSMPKLFVGTMKVNSFCNFEEKELAAVLTSSGTKGQKTQSFFDHGSMRRLQSLAYNTFRSIGFTSDIPAHYFLLSYDINKAENVGTSWSDKQLLELAPALSTNWMIEWNEQKGEFVFDSEKWAHRFVALSREAPVRLLGFPAFMYKLTEDIRRLYGKIRVHEASFIIAGGGWKNHLNKAMSLKEFAAYMEENTGINPANIRDIYGMAEHGVPYCSCSEGHFHIPVYSRLLVRDPMTMAPRGYGEEGLLQLMTPYNMAQPNLSLLSSDLAVLERDCPCGIKGDYIKTIRRGGITKHKGCAIAAQEILNK